jgi:ATP/maltotriose-dependent transcriptional regulator MalT
MRTCRSSPGSALRPGREALARGRWREAAAWFRRALKRDETPEALEGLGTAAWWLDDAPAVFSARERAFRLYRQRGNRRGAARVATALAGDALQFRGEAAVARGWHRRAHRLLEGLPLAPEHGWLLVSDAEFALACSDDPARVRTIAAKAAALGRSLGAVDLEMVALAIEGVALVTEGKRAQGLERLDEASTAATSGEMTDPMAIGICCCYVVTACERIRDFERAAQWCARVKKLCEATRFNALLGVCRAQYGSVLTWRGAWAEAEDELVAAARQLAVSRPAMQADALVRLAELRRSQGRFDEARRLLDRADAHPLATLARAALALDAGDPATAARAAQRALRQTPAANRVERAWALDTLVRAHAALGQHRDAAVALDDVRRLASEIGTTPFRASARSAEGVVALAAGDVERARAAFEDAVDLFRRSHALFEAARARVDLGRALMAGGQTESARAELRQADDAFRALGAPRRRDRVAALLRDAATPRRPARLPNLTRREIDVLRLVAQGLSNRRIGRTLTVSEFTVKRHVANILTKLDVPSRAGAAAVAAQRGLLPLVRTDHAGG